MKLALQVHFDDEQACVASSPPCSSKISIIETLLPACLNLLELLVNRSYRPLGAPPVGLYLRLQPESQQAMVSLRASGSQRPSYDDFAFYSGRKPSRYSRTHILLVLLVSALIVLIYHLPSASSSFSDRIPTGLRPTFERYHSKSDAPRQFDDLTLRPADRHERVTLIAVYGNGNAATYLPLFFQTAAQNSRSLDLLFVNVDQGGGCIDASYVTDPSSPTYASNIKHLCVTEKENDELYRAFICKGWKHGCDASADRKIMAHLEKIREEPKRNHDEIFNTFKPWRGLVYKDWLRTTWWAW